MRFGGITVALILLFLGPLLLATGSDPRAGESQSKNGNQPTKPDFQRQIRPILADNCFTCHGPDEQARKGKLRLDTREQALKGGTSGDAAVVPGKPEASELIRRVTNVDMNEQMPPPKTGKKLSAAQIDLLKKWITEGAEYPTHWAFVAPRRPALPIVKDSSWPRNLIDAFILSRLNRQGLQPSPEASREALLRRLAFDLIGLPPTPEEVDAFLADQSPDAYEKQVERLLQSPHYGERLALPWLDAARYADSNGFQQDGDTFQWVWRDWVVSALNANMPFDRFTIEQLAGDLLPNATLAQKIASAFNRNHLVNGEGGAIPEEQRFNNLFDRVDTTATNWMGLTMACAQCHDHKYDPITQRDYYGLLAGFNNLSESDVAGRQSDRVRVSPPFIDAAAPEQKARLAELEKRVAVFKGAFTEQRKVWEEKIAADENYPDKEIRKWVLDGDSKKKEDRDKRLREHFSQKVAGELKRDIQNAEAALARFKDDYPLVMVMVEDRPRDTHILDRGEYLKPKEKVAFATPAILPPLPADAPGNRLGLAQWLMSPEHPLTARVAVNRHWQTFFGHGLVKTSEDFGVQGEAPVHQDLLDWLAVEFRESGWDVKRLHRLIVLSATYRQSSRTPPEHLAADPENRLLGRFPRLRLPAMILRDAALAAGGLLDVRLGGKPIYPYQPEGIWEPLAITKERDFTYPRSHGRDLHRRSLYTFWRRTIGPANMFDASPRQTCKVRPSVTNTPLHVLTTLNDPTWTEGARVLAERTLKNVQGTEARLAYAFRQVLSRPPRPQELAVLKKMFEQQREAFAADPAAAEKAISVGESPGDKTLEPVEHAAWSAICLALFNLDEALTRE